tara:strand:- start:70 stop:300 length:231 start_codon:yes stop_codon:yes gene_type:complete
MNKLLREDVMFLELNQMRWKEKWTQRLKGRSLLQLLMEIVIMFMIKKQLESKNMKTFSTISRTSEDNWPKRWTKTD